jgi:hypothetical protein
MRTLYDIQLELDAAKEDLEDGLIKQRTYDDLETKLLNEMSYVEADLD